MDKGKIRSSYDRHARYYDANSPLQRYLADRIAASINGGFRRALDIGCGTGHLSLKLNGRKTYACDLSLGMLKAAKKKLVSVPIFQADAQYLPFAKERFDLVVSNAAYQWTQDLKAVLSEVKRVLKKGGAHYFTIFGNRTLWQLQEAIGAFKIPSSDFVDEDKLSDVLESCGFYNAHIETLNFTRYYTDLRDLLGRLRYVSAKVIRAGLGWRGILKRTEQVYRDRFGNDNGIPATYEIFLVRANKG